MLTSIKLKNAASYRDEQALGPLKVLNFIYGENGCGKSTIAKFLDYKMNCTEVSSRFSECSFEAGWKEGETRKLFVYDADFVRKTISQSTLDGVFVLGEDAPELEAELNRHTLEIENKKSIIGCHGKNKNDLTDDIKKAESKFKEHCWQVGKKYSETFEPAYRGTRNSQAKFMEYCLRALEATREIKPLEELKEAVSLYFSPNGKPVKLPVPPLLSWAEFTALTPSPLLGTSIKGREETTVAELIMRLGNSDWVDQGRAFFDDEICPFCQQKTPHGFKTDLENYFDATYQKNRDCISAYATEYRAQMEQLTKIIASYAEYASPLLNYEKIEFHLKTIEVIIRKNNSELAKKEKELSETVQLEQIEERLDAIRQFIDNARGLIFEFNTKIEKFDEGMESLVEDVWSFLGNEIAPQYTIFKNIRDGKTRGINNISEQVARLTEEITAHKKAVSDIGDKLKNAAKPAEDINNTLRSFGFENFSLKKEGDQARYSIVRNDGKKANETLSEGEKTFIAFLYFYQIVRGVSKEQNIAEDKIVIFDDPVSSLDSKVLYVVSTLIKSLAALKDRYKIKQIFMLTHNVYFFKEVTNLQKEYQALSQYWIIRKKGGNSYLERHDKNPVRTSYQMLWEEVIQAKDNPEMDVRNTLRRIIENYFELFGNISNKWLLAEKFHGDDKLICHSLLQWTNDGSHCVFDDIFVAPSVEGRNNYLRVFKDVFYQNGHGEHYRMMMHEENNDEEAVGATA